MRKTTASCLVLLLLLSVAPVTSAKPQNDWSNLKNFIGQPVAIKTRDGFTEFGVLGFVDDSQMKIQLADDVRVSAQEKSFQRGEVAKVWQAKLRFGETRTLRGALIGLGVGLGIGYVTSYALARRGPPHGFALFPITGATLGAKVGSSRTKNHKKGKLIYGI